MTDKQLLRKILEMGRRDCTWHYDDGRFIIDNLGKWDEFCEKILKEDK